MSAIAVTVIVDGLSSMVDLWLVYSTCRRKSIEGRIGFSDVSTSPYPSFICNPQPCVYQDAEKYIYLRLQHT